jgi:hypothetical protein
LDFCDLGFLVVLVLDFFLDFGLGDGEDLVDEVLERLRAEAKDGRTMVSGTTSVMMSEGCGLGVVIVGDEVWFGDEFDSEFGLDD